MNKKTLVFLVFAFALGFGGIFIINRSNYYKECGMVTEKVKDKNGNWTTTEKHFYKENYSF